MVVRNVTFDMGIVNVKMGVVRAVSQRNIDVEIIAPGAPSLKSHGLFSKFKSGPKASHSIADDSLCAFATQLPLTKTRVIL